MMSRKEGEESRAAEDFTSDFGLDELTEEAQSEPPKETVKSQKTGKFRRTAMTFFSVRKSLCILPSLFGGRSKWASKRGIGKSRTHEGLCKVDDDGPQDAYVSAGDFEYNQSDCSQPEQKSLSLGRQRKSFKSLFQSFRQHKGQRNAETTTGIIEVPAVKNNTHNYATNCLRSQPAVPDAADGGSNTSTACEFTRVDGKVLKKTTGTESPRSEHEAQPEDRNLTAVVYPDHENTSRCSSEPCLSVPTTFDPTLKSKMPANSSEQLDLMFGDVSSLKSFDSLTGCGDIIADQEDDSVTESTASGERSRNGGKRASCYLTYQGGGEEMALPEDLGTRGLQDMWGDDCICDAEKTDAFSLDVPNSSSSAPQGGGVDASSMADILTPQSEHQESVPNSDEGYYDSTTPGPDDGQDKSDRLRSGRLPRDSYSGDALYELFAPDESLISPHYENKSLSSGSKHEEYLTDAETSLKCLEISAEMYKKDFLDVHLQGQREISSRGNSKLQTSENMNITADGKRPQSVNAGFEERCRTLSFGSTSDGDFESFCKSKDENLEEKSQSESCDSFSEHGQTVCFSQALVDFTKHVEMLGNMRSDSEGLEKNPAFSPNMEALPTIVTFDVVDMHNEGEYDEQLQMELEEDMSSSYPEFEESYLQKDAFAECDYQMLDLYEQNLISDVPQQHPRVSPSMSSATQSLNTYRESRTEDGEYWSYYKTNVECSMSEDAECNNILALSWQKSPELALKQFSSSASKSQHVCSNTSDCLGCNSELYSDSCTFVYPRLIEEESDGFFCKNPVSHAHDKAAKSHSPNPPNSAALKDQCPVIDDAGISMACSGHPEPTCN